MEFGRIFTDPDEIDFNLPDDPVVTTETLKLAEPKGELQVYVGASKWTNPTWIGKVFTRDIGKNEYLAKYAHNFNTVEFGPTFYTLLKAEDIQKWTAMVEDVPGFKFLPKFPQMISHIRRLANAEDATAKFYESLNAFGNHLGPLLLQVGDNFSPKSFKELKAYLEVLPQSIPVALEIRNKDWYNTAYNRDNLFNALKNANITWAITDASGRRDCVHMHLPTPHAIIRFVGNNLHHTDYTRIDAWVERLSIWKDQGLQSIWFYIHQSEDERVPELCNYLIKQLNTKLGTSVKGPNLIKG